MRVNQQVSHKATSTPGRGQALRETPLSLLPVAFPKDKMASGTNRVTIAKGHANTVAIGHIQRIRRLLTPHIQGKVTPLTQDDFPVWTVVSVLEICLMSFRV